MDNYNQEEDVPEIQDYKAKNGNVSKVLNLNPKSQYQFSFGVAKAKLILLHIDAIRDFVQECDNG
jgi:hypothetical protein